ncbi:MAG: histidine kinase [Aerococcus viridans]|uniref:histidine kinase n=2 Tax=Aerococcus agrisoli TaxID=2487350 RepID=A0A3N4H638_9LACT|nr:MAG: histidine kinase [Aerococcus viridans]RPA60624.1 sensor histidine kinase [Aerococcus agrisoli]
MQKKKSRMHTELFFEAIVWLAILIILYFGIMFVLITAYETNYSHFLRAYPGSFLVRPQFQQNFFLSFTMVYIVLSITFVGWRIYRRLRAVQLGYVLDELHYISQGNFHHKIAVDEKNGMQPVVDSINRLVDSTVKAREEERRIEQSKDDLITNMSHDIRTPLTSVIGYLTLLKQEELKDPEKAMKYINIAYDKALQMQRMTEDLFEYTKVKQVDTKLAISNINVVRMVEQITVEFELESTKVGREFQIIAHPADNIMVDIDPEKFVRIFSNLFTNVFKYGGKGKYIKIIIVQNQEDTTFTVENDGAKIPKNQLKDLFQRFYRGDKSRTEPQTGSGLGLAITQSIIELHRGEIYAESDNKGTRFIFTIPNRFETDDKYEEMERT